MMIKGTYIFYEDGKEIYRSSNVITKFGKRFLTSHLAGLVSFQEKDMALGIASNADYSVSDTNSRLGFEFYRLPIDFGSTNIQSNGSGGFDYSVIYKTTIPQDVVGIIKEVGLYPGRRQSKNSFDSKFITDFENNLVWFDSNGYNPPIVSSVGSVVPRIGASLIKISTSSGSLSKEYFSDVNQFDLSGYSVNDTITFAYYQADANLSEIKVRFYSSTNNYYEASIPVTSSVGDKIGSINLYSMLNSPVGSPDASTINKIGVYAKSTTGTGTDLYVDGIRINDEDTFDPAYGMISRTALASELVKVAGRQVDIEYRLDLFV